MRRLSRTPTLARLATVLVAAALALVMQAGPVLAGQGASVMSPSGGEVRRLGDKPAARPARHCWRYLEFL